MERNSCLERAVVADWDLAWMAARCASAISLSPLLPAKATRACMASTPRPTSPRAGAPPPPAGRTRSLFHGGCESP
eukprot:7660924-Pyramimonas_sp.AAC.1